MSWANVFLCLHLSALAHAGNVTNADGGVVHCSGRGGCDCDCSWANPTTCGHDDGSCCFGCCCRSPSPPPPSPPAPSPPAPAGGTPRGCGVALAGDWPNTGGQFDSNYSNLDIVNMMKNAQDVAYFPLWRYDWRSSQHPFTSSWWTYVSMDWCWRGGKNEHPNPADSSPGLMGWNEPNVQGQCAASDATDQSGVTEFVNLASQYKARGKFVVSPAPGGYPHWVDVFLWQLQDRGFFGIDYIAYHHYVTCNSGTTGDDMYGEMSRLLNNMIWVMNKYNSQGFQIKGIWLTEIACAPEGGWGARPYRWDSSKPPMLMGKFIDIINNYPQLQAWNWFGYNGFGPLWNYGSWTLTDLGRTYFSNCHGNRAPLSLDTVRNVTYNASLSNKTYGRPGHFNMSAQADLFLQVVV